MFLNMQVVEVVKTACVSENWQVAEVVKAACVSENWHNQ